MIQATLHQLRVFEATARHSSFTKAAEELFITQPTVSTQVKQLTKAVGLPLFEQIGKLLFLTEAGQELLSYRTPKSLCKQPRIVGKLTITETESRVSVLNDLCCP